MSNFENKITSEAVSHADCVADQSDKNAETPTSMQTEVHADVQGGVTSSPQQGAQSDPQKKESLTLSLKKKLRSIPVSYTHLTLPTKLEWCRSRWSPYH